MKLQAHTILMITSFVPVAAFKVVARMGNPGLGQAKIAALAGFILALAQAVLSRKILKQTTYLERAFLGFLGVGALWVYATPAETARLFVAHSTTLLYLVLFLTTLLPQMFGYDPFTYAIAKQWYPETVWHVPQFRTINLHITYVWSAVFFTAALSCLLGDEKPFFSILVPLALILGCGLPFSGKYPDHYLKKAFSAGPVDLSVFPATARELVSRMPLGFDAQAASGLTATIQFDFSGDDGGKMFLSIANGRCAFQEGVAASSTLTIHSSGDTWLKIARSEVERPRALMDGLFSVEGDMALLMKMGRLFHAPTKVERAPLKEEDVTARGGEKVMKIVAVQGSPRPKTSNTEVLLQEFLNGARSEGAEAETIYLKEKKIHPCIGCYTCWTKTPGVCVFKDDMPELLAKVRQYDVIVYATPLYIFNVSALMKAFQERMLPLLDPHLIKDGETYRHPKRYDWNPRMVLVSTCGFPEVSHFHALRHLFRHIEKTGQARIAGELLVPAAELVLRQEFIKERAKEILQGAYQAGIELVRDGSVSKETEARIQQQIVSEDEMAGMANMWWDSHDQGITEGKANDRTNVEDMRLLLRGMALTFNAPAAGDLKAAIQFDVTGKQPGKWFLSIENGTCTYNEGQSPAPTLTIKTPSEVWLAIANKEKNGQEAFMAGEYKVEGDISLLMRLGSLFG